VHVKYTLRAGVVFTKLNEYGHNLLSERHEHRFDASNYALSGWQGGSVQMLADQDKENEKHESDRDQVEVGSIDDIFR
jgi:hypothetical protein